MSVLNLQNIADQAICGQGAAEIPSRIFIPLGARLRPELEFKVVDELWVVSAHLLLNIVNTVCIDGHFEEPGHGPCSQDLIGAGDQSTLCLVEDLLHLTDKLHSELLLPHIVIRLHDDFNSPPGP